MLRYLILLSRCCIFLNSATSCYAATSPSLPSDCFWSCDLAFMILICLIFSASCYVFDLPCLRWGPVSKMLCCLNFSISYLAASQASLPHVAWCALSLYQIFAFRSLDVVFMVLSYLIWSASRNILEAPYLMLCCVLFFMSGAKLVFDLVFVVLSCVIFSTSASFV